MPITATTSKEKDIDDVISFTFMDAFISSITISGCRKSSNVFMNNKHYKTVYLLSWLYSSLHSFYVKRLDILINLIKWKKWKRVYCSRLS